jgi:hypothetical protein
MGSTIQNPLWIGKALKVQSLEELESIFIPIIQYAKVKFEFIIGFEMP